jgi:hypothetical protein
MRPKINLNRKGKKMKTETRKRVWDDVTRQLNIGQTSGKNFRLRFDAEFRPYIVIFNGQRWTLPDDVIAALTDDARATIEVAAREARKARECEAAKYRAEREALNARLDEPGFTLLAGENTDVVCRGTLRQCRESLWKVIGLPRDPYCGRGCWVIVDSQRNEVESGEFDKDMVL